MKSARLKVVRGISTVALTAVISLASCRLACAKVTTVDSAGQTNVSEEDLIITSNVDYESLDVNLLEDDAMLAIFGEGNEPDIVTVKVKDLTFTGVAGAASNCLMIDSRGDLIVDGDVVVHDRIYKPERACRPHGRIGEEQDSLQRPCEAGRKGHRIFQRQ